MVPITCHRGTASYETPSRNRQSSHTAGQLPAPALARTGSDCPHAAAGHAPATRGQHGGFFQNETCAHHTTQQLHSLISTQTSQKLSTTRKRAHSFIHNFPNLEATRTPCSYCAARYSGPFTTESSSAPKRKSPPATKRQGRNQKCRSLSEGSRSEKPTPCMIPTPWHPRQGRTLAVVRPVVGRGSGVGGGRQRETTLHDTTITRTCHHTFVQPHRAYHQE